MKTLSDEEYKAESESCLSDGLRYRLPCNSIIFKLVAQIYHQ